MPYRDCLKRWLIVRLLPDMQNAIIAHFYKRADAEGHLQVIQRLSPDDQFAIMFNPEVARSRAPVES